MTTDAIVRLYFDTNVYTEILALPSTRYSNLCAELTGPGFEVRLSPTNMIEFLAAPDPLQRERLIFLAQQICSPNLLPEVERIVVHYVAETSKHPALTNLLLANDDGTGPLAAAWRDAKSDLNRTLLVEQNLVDRFRAFRALFDTMHAHFRRGDSLAELLRSLPGIKMNPDDPPELALKLAAATRRSQSQAPDVNELKFRSRDAAILLMVIIVCTGLTPFEEPIEALWRELAVPREERLVYAIRHFSFLVEAGPLVGMALALAAQWRRKSESGNAFDLYHVAYLPLTHLLFTNDAELINVASALSDSEPFTRVKSFKTLGRASGA